MADDRFRHKPPGHVTGGGLLPEPSREDRRLILPGVILGFDALEKWWCLAQGHLHT